MLTELDKKIIHHLLEMASEEFSNHGCNDFDLRELMPDVNDRRALAKELGWPELDPDDYGLDRDYAYTIDYLLMSYMANKVKNS